MEKNSIRNSRDRNLRFFSCSAMHHHHRDEEENTWWTVNPIWWSISFSFCLSPSYFKLHRPKHHDTIRFNGNQLTSSCVITNQQADHVLRHGKASNFRLCSESLWTHVAGSPQTLYVPRKKEYWNMLWKMALQGIIIHWVLMHKLWKFMSIWK